MKDFTNGNEAKLIFKFALPMLVGNIFQQLYNVIDSVIVGKVLGDEALAAVGASFPIIFMIVALIIGIGIGAGVVISQNYGAKRYAEVKRASSTILLFLLLAGLIISFIGIAFSRSIFTLLQLPNELMDQAVTYLNVFMGGMVVMFGFNAISSILRGVGDSKTPLFFLIISTLSNIALDILFVVYFKWGIAGAAWATVISQGVAFAIALSYLSWTKHFLRIKLDELVFDWTLFKQSLKLGLPTGIQQTIVALGGMALMGLVNTFGTTVIAAYSAASRLDSLAVIPTMSFAAALSGFVGQNIGAGKLARARRGMIATIKMSVMFSISISVLMAVKGRNLMAIFTDSSNVVDVGYHYLVIVSLFYAVFSLMFSINGLLRGAGATIIPMFITLLSLWGVRLPLAFLLSQTFGMNEVGIWWSIPMGWGMGAVAAFLYYRFGNWSRKAVLPVYHT